VQLSNAREADTYFNHEKFLAGKTRTVLLLVVRLYDRGQDQLDGRSKLHCAKQFAQDEKGRRSALLS